MGIPHFHPLRPTWPHIRNRQALMSTAQQDFFVYVTTTYARRQKWDAVLTKFPFDSGTWARNLIENVDHDSNRRPEFAKGGSWPISRVLSRAAIPLGAVSPRPSSSLPGSTRDSRLPTGLATGGRLPYLALLQVGFAVPSVLPRPRCALTAPFHPCQHLLRGTSAVCSLLHFPWARAPQALPGTLSTGARTFLPGVRLRTHRGGCLASSPRAP